MTNQTTVRMTRAQDKGVAEANVPEAAVDAWKKQGWLVATKLQKTAKKVTQND